MKKIKLVFENGLYGEYRTPNRVDYKVKNMPTNMLKKERDAYDYRDMDAFVYYGCHVISIEDIDGRCEEARDLKQFSYVLCYNNLKHVYNGR